LETWQGGGSGKRWSHRLPPRPLDPGSKRSRGPPPSTAGLCAVRRYGHPQFWKRKRTAQPDYPRRRGGVYPCERRTSGRAATGRASRGRESLRAGPLSRPPRRYEQQQHSSTREGETPTTPVRGNLRRRRGWGEPPEGARTGEAGAQAIGRLNLDVNMFDQIARVLGSHNHGQINDASSEGRRGEKKPSEGPDQQRREGGARLIQDRSTGYIAADRRVLEAGEAGSADITRSPPLRSVAGAGRRGAVGGVIELYGQAAGRSRGGRGQGPPRGLDPESRFRVWWKSNSRNGGAKTSSIAKIWIRSDGRVG